MTGMQINGQMMPRDGYRNEVGQLVDDQAIELQRSIDSLYAAINSPDTGLVDRVIAVEVKLDKILEFVAAISQEITPVIDQIATSPVGKMLGMKKKEMKTDE